MNDYLYILVYINYNWMPCIECSYLLDSLIEHLRVDACHHG